MYAKPKLPIDSGFGIWFNKKEKSEYYVTPLYFHRIKKIKYIYNNFDTIKLTDNVKRNSIFRNNTDYFNPYTERYGRFLINFLNADFSSYKTSYNTFFAFYGIELLKEYSKNLLSKYSYTNKEDFYKDLEELFNNCKENIIDLQNQFRECVNYTYKLKDSNDSEYTCMERFISFVLRNDLYKYSINTQLFFNNLSGYKIELSRLSNSKPSEIRKKIKNNEISPKTSNIFYSNYLSNIVFLSLYEIATNEYIIIKNCQNCGKYFIPTTKQTEIYCDITYAEKERSCRETGAGETYKKNINEVEGYVIYRRTYQKRLMQIKRNPDPNGKDIERFNAWKSKAQSKIKNFKKGLLTEDDLTTWMKNNQDT